MANSDHHSSILCLFVAWTLLLVLNCHGCESKNSKKDEPTFESTEDLVLDPKSFQKYMHSLETIIIGDSEYRPKEFKEKHEEEAHEDMKLTQKQKENIIKEETSHSRRKRKLTEMPGVMLWDKNDIPYTFYQAYRPYDERGKNMIRSGLKHWEDVTCLKFSEKKPHGNKAYLQFVKGAGCSSRVGRTVRSGAQLISLGLGCLYLGIVAHEVGHAMGYYHEQSREDRDSSVRILWDPINPYTKHNFRKLNTKQLHPYDYMSIMHYSRYTFSKNGKETIDAIDKPMGRLLGQRSALSFYDIKGMNKIYKCDEKCHTRPKCKNEGFVTKECHCRCPFGLTGRTCTEVISDKKCGGVINLSSHGHVLTSPNYPRHYPRNSNCTWLIKAPSDKVVTFRMTDMALKYESNRWGKSCFDYVELRYHALGNRGVPYCGTSDTGIHKHFVADTNTVIVHFVSNAGSGKRGFKIEFSTARRVDCSSRPCQHNGICHQIDPVYTCQCKDPYYGRNCERSPTNPNPKHPAPAPPVTKKPRTVPPRTTQPPTTTTTTTTTTKKPKPPPKTKKPHPPRMTSPPKTKEPTPSKHRGTGKILWSCDFEKDFCGLLHKGKFEWMRKSGSTTTWDTGPSRAASGNYYIYTEANNYNNAKYGHGPSAIIETPLSQATGEVCVRFHYSMYGKDIGRLSVIVAPSSVVWSIKGDQGKHWQKTEVGVNMKASTRIRFVGELGNGKLGDIALDNMTITDGSCFLPATKPPRVISKKKSLSEWNCDFEEGNACSMVQDKSDDFDWTIHKGATPSHGTGPDAAADGTWYMYLEASNPRQLGDEALIMLPPLKNQGKACLSFQYHMYGHHIGRLVVVVREGASLWNQWSEGGRDKGNEWHSARVKLTLKSNSLVGFLGVIGNGHQGDIAVDGIKVNFGDYC